MKKLKYLAMLTLSMFVVTTNVKAISTSDELSDCIYGTKTICKLTSDFTMTNPITIMLDREVTLDLNGYTLDIEHTILFNGNGKLTVTGNGTIKTDSPTAGYMFDVYPGSTLILENGNFTNTVKGGKIIGVTGSETDPDMLSRATVIVKEKATLSANYGIVVRHAGSNASYGAIVDFAGTIKAISGNNGYNDGSVGVFVNGTIKKSNGNVPEIKISGGNITTTVGTTGDPASDSAPALSASGYANWIITGGDITGTEAIAIKAGNFDISGGVFTATGKYYDPANGNTNGSEATGAAISITATKNYSNSVKLNISNATVISKLGNAIYEGISVDKDGNKTTNSSAVVENGLTISGGTFTAEDDTKTALDIEKEVKEFISGGEFSSDINKIYLNNDLESSKQEDGSYLVGTRYNITICEAVEGTITTDKTSAINGEIITLTVIPKEGYKIKSITADGEEVKDNKFIMPNKDVEVKVLFAKIVEGDTAPENPTEEDIIVTPEASTSTNPKTGDNFLIYGLLLIIAITGLKLSLRTRKTH